ncbi:MAG: hypothetical protein PSV22_25825 [Pseudolabrys sp.]|nr:hypothetical protein [Pseudolabrys sp.]
MNVQNSDCCSSQLRFGFISASVRLTNVGFGQDELDKVTKLSSDLQKMGKWNFWAAAFTGIAVVAQIIVRYGWTT